MLRDGATWTGTTAEAVPDTAAADSRTIIAFVDHVLTSVATVWLYLSIRHNPGGDYPTPVYEDGIPAWWPGWIRL